MTSRPTRPVLEEFEPRILYSADFAPAALAGLSLPGPSDQRLLQAQETPAATPAALEVAFVDLSLPEAQTLIDDLQAQRDAGRTIEIVRINAGEDGISRISEALNGRTDISAVHVLSHGSDAAVQLGNVRLDAATLLVRAGELAQWSDALTQNADLLLYGCDVAASATGQQLLASLAALTGADVAASDDPTGNEALGGNWELEVRTGQVDAGGPFSATFRSQWVALLPTYQSFTGYTSEREVKSDANHGQTFQHNSGGGTYSVDQISLALRRDIDAPSQTLTVTLRNSWNGSVIASSTIASSSLGTSLAFHDFNVSGVALDDNQSYTLRVTSSTMASKVYIGFNPSGGYAGGTQIDTNGAALVNEDLAFKVGFVGANSAPVITNNGGGATAAVSVAENTTAVTTVTATDADLPAQTLTYSISSGVDAAKFSIDSGTGALRFVTAPNYELPTDAGGNNVYDVTVRVSDGLLFATQALAVTVTDIGGPLIVATTADVLDGNVSSIEALVGNPGADGLISLREAISAANNTAGTDTINFAVNGTFSIAGSSSGDNTNAFGDFDVNGSVNIVGNGTGSTIINGNGNDRVFDLRSGTIGLTGLTVQGGRSSLGGGISVGAPANVTLSGVVIQNNEGNFSSKGGGIYNDGVLTLQNAIVQNNGSGFFSDVDGAGIFSDKDATLIANNVEIRNNSADGGKDGGGLYVWESASVQLTNVTFANNHATRGGGLWNHDNSTSLLNVTFSGNSASSEGGGIWADRTITLDHVTVANNSAVFWGGGTYDSNNNITAKNSLFAGNAGGNTNRAPVSQGYNLSDDNSPGFLGTGDQKNVAAGLLALSNNGGFTRTHAIAAGSAARDAANPVPAVGTDQRGIAYSGGRGDIGAYEYNLGGFVPTISAVVNQTIDENTALGPISFTIGDVESGAGSLIVSATSSNTALVPNANIVLGGSGASRTISLTPAPNANSSANGGPTTITLSVSDGGNVTTTTFSVTVQSVNNAPTLTLPAAQTVDEATQLVLSGTNAPSIGDADAGTASLQVTLTATNGTLKLSQTTGLSFVTGNSGFNATMTFSGSLADINAALDGLRYKPADGYTGAAQIDLSVNDLGNSGSGGAKTAGGSIGINVVAVNDAPLLGLPGAQATPQPTPLTFAAASGNAITVSDADAGSSDVQLSLSTSALANGTLSFGTTSGLTLVSGSGTNDTSVVLRGTLADLNAALATLSFSATGAGAARIDITLDDLGNTGSGGAKQASGAVAITVANDALPVLTLSQTSFTFTENDAATPLDTALTISDSDNPTLASAVVRINSGYSGTEDVLAFTNVPATMGNIAGSYSAGVLSLSSAGQSATLAEWQAALRSITYVNTSDAPSTTPRTVTLTVNDGIADSGTRNITLNVQAVNEAPVLGSANDLASIPEDTLSNPGTLVATLIAGQISDVDAAAQVGIAVTGANDANGVWQYTTDGGSNWSAFNDGFDTASNTSARLLTADANSAVRFVPNGNWNGTLAGALTFRAWDQTLGSAGGTADTSVNGGSSAFSSATASSDITVTPVNDAPVLAGPIAAQAATQGVGFVFALPAGSFTDADTGDVLTYTATLASGAALPTWLSFDAGTQTFSGTPGNADVGAISVRVTARDGSDGVFGDFTLDVANVNDTPLLVSPIADQPATQDVAFVFGLPADSFTDADAGDVLTLTATLAGGGALPTWLSFDANTLTFSGTPGNADVGAISVRVTATDSSNATVFDDFTLTVANANDAPTVAAPIADQNATQGAAFSFTLPSGSFADIDVGDTLSYGATLSGGGALPAWLSFNAATQSFTGTPGNADVGAINVRITATDASNAGVFDDFTLTVADANDAPTVAAPIADQSATQGAAFSFTLPGGSFADIDVGDTLSYGATLSGGGALPAWLSFNAATQSFTGTPGNADVGAINVRITATDASNAGVFDDFTLTVANVNDAPTVAAPIADQNAMQGTAFSFTLPGGSFADIDTGDTLSYSATLASGAALPAWLSFDANTLTFSGTPGNADVGAINVRITATDASNAGAFDDFMLTVANTNDAPVITSNGGCAAASVRVAENNTTVTSVTATDSDALAVLRFAITGGTDAARFGIDPVSGALSFVAAPDLELPADANRDNRYEVIVSVSDGALRAQQSLFIDVVNVDEAPSIVTNALLLSNRGATLVLLGTDPDTGVGALSYQVSGQLGGRFELVAAPGVAVTGFNQAQVDAGAVRFVADASGTSPTYVLSLSDGVSTVTSGAPNVVQQASPPDAALPVVPAVATPATPPAATPTAAAPAAAPPAAAPAAAVPATPGPLSPALLTEPRYDTFESARAPSSSAAVAVPAASTATRDSTVTAVATLAQFALLSESSDNAATAGAPTIDLASALRDRLLGEQLDRQRDSAETSQRSVKELQAASATLTTGLSVGYVLWLARGGVLVASLMSALPAWAMVDPLPVLAQMKRRDGRADDGADDDAADDPLERLFSKARQVVARGAAVPPTPSTPTDAKLVQGRSAADKNSFEQPA